MNIYEYIGSCYVSVVKCGYFMFIYFLVFLMKILDIIKLKMFFVFGFFLVISSFYWWELL